MNGDFARFWKNFAVFEKRLSRVQLEQVRDTIKELEESRTPSSQIITALQDKFPDLKERYAAERAYWTESKAMETTIIEDSAEDLDLKKFKIVLSPAACPLCRSVTNDGDKVFIRSQLVRGNRKFPPIHPNCYCILIPLRGHD